MGRIDGVVEQLKDEADRSFCDFERYADEIGIDYADDWYFKGLKRAVEIIKAAEQDNRPGAEKDGQQTHRKTIPVDGGNSG